MSYKEMRKLAKSLSTYKKPRLTLFGNAVSLVATKPQQSSESVNSRKKRPPKNNGNNNGNGNGNNNGNGNGNNNGNS